MLDAKALYLVYAGNTATAAMLWDDGTVDLDRKDRWAAVANAVTTDRDDAIADVIARRETTTPERRKERS